MKNNLLKFLFLPLFCLFHVNVFGQEISRKVTFYITETFSNTPLSFVEVTRNDSNTTTLGGVDGYITCHLTNQPTQFSFKKHLHRNAEINYSAIDSISQNDTITIKLNKYLLYGYQPTTDSVSFNFIQQVIQRGTTLKLNQINRSCYEMYSKLTIDVTDNNKINHSMKKWNAIGVLKLYELNSNQHLYIMEVFSKRKVKNKIHHIEEIEAVNTSGIRVPGVVMLTSHLQYLNIYNPFIVIKSKEYISPIESLNSINRYNYTILDTVTIKNQELIVVQFTPKHHRNFSALNGILYIHSKTLMPLYASIEPAYTKKEIVEVNAEFEYINGILYTKQQQLHIHTHKPGTSVNPIFNIHTTLKNFQSNQKFPLGTFKETIMNYQDDYTIKDSTEWNQLRTFPLNQKDQNTFNYFNYGINTFFIQKFLNIGQNILFGIVPLKYVNIDLNKVLNFNRWEGTRIGIGGETTPHLSKHFVYSLYFGYGIKDKKWKYGIGIKYKFLDPMNSYVSFQFNRELSEAGGTNYLNETKQYSTESIRRFALEKLDLNNATTLSIGTHPFTYTDIETSITYNQSILNYNYYYKGQEMAHQNGVEWNTQVRFAYGEKQIKMNEFKIKQPSKFPIVYFNLIKGFILNNTDIDYFKSSFKVEQNLKILDLGRTGIQLSGGITNSNTPYNKMFVGKGSSNNAGVVIHNTFETMGYNEFVANEFINLFISHDFGRMYYRSPYFMPSFMLLLNQGWGRINNNYIHGGVPNQDYVKGFREAGIFLNNILVLDVSGLRAGIGAGTFLRYGNYQFDKTGDNFLFKFSLYLTPAN
jgi:hypothetical protein